jgi:hypothetical protein
MGGALARVPSPLEGQWFDKLDMSGIHIEGAFVPSPKAAPAPARTCQLIGGSIGSR